MRRGLQANTSERRDAMEIMEEIVDTLCNTVVYDRNKWLALQQYNPTGPDKVRGGYGEEGPTVERVRQTMILEMSGPGSAVAVRDSLKEANSSILDGFGLQPGSQYSGGATCFSASSWAAQTIRGSVTRYNKKSTRLLCPYRLNEMHVIPIVTASMLKILSLIRPGGSSFGISSERARPEYSLVLPRS
jgi:hypothetical protein